jgi:hypothetical protein
MPLSWLARPALVLALLLPIPVMAQATPKTFDAVREALLAVWGELPLTVRNVTLIDGPATGFGGYTARAGSTYAAGETIHVYVEVLGYGWRDNGDGTVSRLLDADLRLLDQSGVAVASQDKFVSDDFTSHEKTLETYLAFDVAVSKFAGGDYTLHFTLHDRSGEAQTVFDVPITLSGDAGGSSSAAGG